MKLLKRIAILSLCALSLVGCTQSSVSSEDVFMVGSDFVPGKEVTEDIIVERSTGAVKVTDPLEFDWEQVAEDANDMFMDEEYYPLTVEMSFSADVETPTIDLMWTLKNEASEEEVMEYAVELVQKFNDILAIQKTTYETSTMDSFGSIWDTFALNMTLTNEDGETLLDKSYAAGETIDLELPEYEGEGPQASTEKNYGPADMKKN